MKNLFKGGVIKETMGRLISKFFIYESVLPSKADFHHFKNMIVGTQQAGNYYNLVLFILTISLLFVKYECQKYSYML